MNRTYSSNPRSLQVAKEFASILNRGLTKGTSPRHFAVVVAAPTQGFHVCTLGFATKNGLEVIR